MATYSSILTWKIPWTEEPGRLQSVGPQRVSMTEHTHIGLHKASNTNGYIGGKIMLLVSEPQTLSWSILSWFESKLNHSLYAQSDYGDQISMTIHPSIY